MEFHVGFEEWASRHHRWHIKRGVWILENFYAMVFIWTPTASLHRSRQSLWLQRRPGLARGDAGNSVRHRGYEQQLWNSAHPEFKGCLLAYECNNLEQVSWALRTLVSSPINRANSPCSSDLFWRLNEILCSTCLVVVFVKWNIFVTSGASDFMPILTTEEIHQCRTRQQTSESPALRGKDSLLWRGMDRGPDMK